MSSEEGAGSLDEVFAELGFYRKNVLYGKGKASFVYPDEGLSSLLQSLRPSIHSTALDSEDIDVECKESNSDGWQETYDTKTSKRDVECKISEGSLDSSTLTIKSDMLGDLKQQILKEESSVSSLQLYDELLKNAEKDKTTVSTATNTFRCCRRSHRLQQRKKSSKSGNAYGRKESDTKTPTQKNENFINYKSDMIDKELLDVHLYQTPKDWPASTFIPAEKGSSCSISNLELAEKDSTFINNYHQEHSIKDKAYQIHMTSTVSTDIHSDFESQSTNRDSIQTVNSKVRGHIFANVDKCFRSPISSRTTSRNSNIRQTRSDTAIANSKNTNGLRKIAYFRNDDNSMQKPKNPGPLPVVYWAIAKINVYPDNYRTYEVMPLMGKRPPSAVPDKSDSVFVLIPPKKVVQNTKMSQK